MYDLHRNLPTSVESEDINNTRKTSIKYGDSDLFYLFITIINVRCEILNMIDSDTNCGERTSFASFSVDVLRNVF